jgi:hypothetical protein
MSNTMFTQTSAYKRRLLHFAGRILLCGLFALAGAKANGQNVVQNVTIVLTGYDQGATNDDGTTSTQKLSTTKVTTATVIQALGTALGTNFSSKAEFQAISNTAGSLQSFVVSDGGQQTDVTTYFTFTPGTSVSKSDTSDSTGVGSQTSYGIQEFTFLNIGGLSFDVQGFTTMTSSTTGASGATTTISQLTASVAGTGTDANGNTTVLRGTISVTGKKVSNSGD